MNQPNTTPLPVVFLHGFSGNQDGLRDFARSYAGDAAVLVNLPGFGGSPAPSIDVQVDFQAYVDATWQQIRSQVPAGPVQLVGHSHGAMMAFAIACRYPESIAKLDLLCPVAMPRLLPRLLAGTLGHLSSIGFTDQMLRLLKWRPMVDLITRHSFQPHWDASVRRRIIETRRIEARDYSSVMFHVMQKAVLFMEQMHDQSCVVPTAIYSVTDDNIAGAKDHEWYVQRCNTVHICRTTGGHLGVLAEPERIAKEFLAAQQEQK